MTDVAEIMRVFASKPRLQILDWLKAPRAHFREQVDGDLVDDGVCGLLIAEKLGVRPPTITGHMRLLVDVGAVRVKRVKQWTFYRRDEERIRALKAAIADEL
jgi:DNA-binding transcriptional ArsR family regulator